MYIYIHMGVPKMGVPQNAWFAKENPTKMDDWGNPHLWKPPFQVT